MQNYSVLMSVYAKEKPEYLRLSMQSMWDQTVPTNDFVLVCDGPLTDGLNAVIAEMQQQHGNVLNVVRLEKNSGLGIALNVGIRRCKNELVARMDSDDISVPERCAREVEVFEQQPNLSIVGSNIDEFIDDVHKIESTRQVPEKNSDIVSFSKFRNPFNHPSVMFRKSEVLSVGGYPEQRFIQDYFLWARILNKEKGGHNIQLSLVKMRAGNDLIRRRSGKEYVLTQFRLQKYMLDIGYITYAQFVRNMIIRVCSGFLPNSLRGYMFKKFLRK